MEYKPTKKYQVWQRDENWFFNEFDTLGEAFEFQTYGEHFITKLVEYKIKELNQDKL
jgi:hypothetical protein